MLGGRWIVVGILGAVVTTAVLTAPLASGDQIERDEYVERAEPICKTNVLANRRIFKGAKTEVKDGELKRASTHFFRAAAAFAKTIQQLEAVPRPADDAARLARWFGLLRDEKVLIEKIGRALAAEQKHKASSYSVDLNRNSIRANNSVLDFGFNYCRIEPSRFSSS
jgi:hypothetical protein